MSLQPTTKKAAIKHWAVDDRPREKLLRYGRQNLSNSELLSILINTGTKKASALEISKKLLSDCNNDLGKFARMTIKELTACSGIGEAKAVTIAAALELGLRRKAAENSSTKAITSSKDSFEHAFIQVGDLNYEQFWVIYLNRANRVICSKCISEGGISEVHVDIKKILVSALENYSSSLICYHNHPSGNLKPSEADIRITNKLKDAAKVLDINLLDHLIIGGNAYFSFADEGLL